jgi:hypothetical protein
LYGCTDLPSLLLLLQKVFMNVIQSMYFQYYEQEGKHGGMTILVLEKFCALIFLLSKIFLLVAA